MQKTGSPFSFRVLPWAILAMFTAAAPFALIGSLLYGLSQGALYAIGSIVGIAAAGIVATSLADSLVLYCPFCGKRVKAGAASCHHCGRNVEGHQRGGMNGRQALLVVAGAIALGLVASAPFAVAYALRGEHRVPDVMGLDRNTAEARIDDAGLGSKAEGAEKDFLDPIVCEQSPAAGAKTKDKVTLSFTSEDCPRRKTAEDAPDPGLNPPPPEPLAGVEAALKKAGYDVTEGGSDTKADASLEVTDGNMQVSIYHYAIPSDLAKDEVTFDPLLRESPKQVAVTSPDGETLFVGTVEEPAILDKGRFKKIVAVADGAR